MDFLNVYANVNCSSEINSIKKEHRNNDVFVCAYVYIPAQPNLFT